MTIFPGIDLPLLNPSQGANVHTYAKAKEPKKKVCTINSQNKNREIDMQVTFILEIKIHMCNFFQNMTIFLMAYASILNSYYDENMHTHVTT